MTEGKAEDVSSQEGIRKILHDLNQPLTAMNNYAQAGLHLLANGKPDHDRLKDLFEKISAQAGRTFEISQALRTAVIDESQEIASENRV